MIRLGQLIQSLALMVMRPADLLEFGKQFYSQPENIFNRGRFDNTNPGLHSFEEKVLEQIPLSNGQLLLLGVGGGREAIPLAQKGFQITGVDFIPQMIEKASENMQQHGFSFNGLVQDISELDVPPDTYDIIWLSAALYSGIPTMFLRIQMLKRIARAMRNDGYCICNFHWQRKQMNSKKRLFLKVVAIVSGGFTNYENGDMLWLNQEFLHAFYDKEKLYQEFHAAGFEIFSFLSSERMMKGATIIKYKKT